MSEQEAFGSSNAMEGPEPKKPLIESKSCIPKSLVGSYIYSEFSNWEFYVDKTMLIKNFLTFPASIIALTAPPRFGKSLNMNMLKTFMEIEPNTQKKNKEYFQGKKIFNDQRFFNAHFGKYPVLNFSFKDVYVDSFDMFVTSYLDVIVNVVNRHQDLKNIPDVQKVYLDYETIKKLDKVKRRKALKDLTEFLFIYHGGKRVVVLIDEFDSPVLKAVTQNVPVKVLNQIKNFISDVIESLLKDNEHVRKALVTGCFYIKDMLPNNIIYVPFLQKPEFDDYYGFNEDEVCDMLAKAGLTDKLDYVKNWYNGFFSLKTGKKYFSPWSVSRFVTFERKFRSLWKGTVYSGIRRLMLQVPIRDKICDVAFGRVPGFIKWETVIRIPELEYLKNMCNVNDVSSPKVNLAMQLLTEMGYFKIVKVNEENSWMSVEVPNEEIRSLLRAEIFNIEYLQNKNYIKAIAVDSFKNAVELFMEKGIEELNAVKELAFRISELFIKVPRNEAEFTAIIFYILQELYLEETVELNPRVCSSDGRNADIGVVLEESALIIKNKFGDRESSISAYSQFLNKRYKRYFDYKKCQEDSMNIALGVHMSNAKKVEIMFENAEGGLVNVSSDEYQEQTE